MSTFGLSRVPTFGTPPIPKPAGFQLPDLPALPAAGGQNQPKPGGQSFSPFNSAPRRPPPAAPISFLDPMSALGGTRAGQNAASLVNNRLETSFENVLRDLFLGQMEQQGIVGEGPGAPSPFSWFEQSGGDYRQLLRGTQGRSIMDEVIAELFPGLNAGQVFELGGRGSQEFTVPTYDELFQHLLRGNFDFMNIDEDAYRYEGR